jgi:threonine dehydrogenase-like Zn-dependent dehydrogenase
MVKGNNEISRRKFLSSSAFAALGVVGHSFLKSAPLWETSVENKLKVALVGTGIRGSGTWGKALLANYGDVLEMVGLCDINPKRLEYAKRYMGAKCPTFVDFEKMIDQTGYCDRNNHRLFPC